MSTEYDVAIVGLGPVGGVLANLVALEGLDVVVFDRETEAPQLPRGVGIDAEVMRVVQTLGLADRLEPVLKVFRGAQYLDVNGNIVSTRPGVEGTLSPQGWPARYNVHQPDFEMVMREGLRRFPNLDHRLGYDVVAVGENDGVGVVTARPVTRGTAVTVTARYVVGCDGARSIVRKAAGLTLDDFGLNQPWIVADFAVEETTDLPPINTHFADAESPVIYIHVVRNLRRFEFRARQGEDLEAAVRPENLWARTARWLTPDQGQLLRAAVYTHRSLVAEHWRKGPLVVAGDAAHQTPPFLGQGLCTGVRDAASLAWRLGAIVRHGASDVLLDSYESERSAHARFFIQTATALGPVLTAPDKPTLDSLNARIGREGQGQTPQLGPGLWQGERPAGMLAPQPRLADGRLLDDAVGFRFAVVAQADTLDRLAADLRRELGAAEIALLPATGETVNWLAELTAVAAVIRPDRYYYGTYDGIGPLATALRELLSVVVPSTVSVAG